METMLFGEIKMKLKIFKPWYLKTIFLKKVFFFIVYFCILFSLFSQQDYFRIVVLGDPHLPTKFNKPKEEDKKERIIQSKLSVIEDINSWNDVSLVVALGDITAHTGSEEEYEFAKNFFAKLNVPFCPILGNHDFIYKAKNKPLIRCSLKEARRKIDKFKETFNLEKVSFTKEIFNYLLIFLSPDSIIGYTVTLSNRTLLFLKTTLEKNKQKPTIIFCHAPLEGTALKNGKPIKNNNVIQPVYQIRKILKANKQVLLWVSGHTHITPKEESFNAPYNLYINQILNIHNPDMDRRKIWTNSIYLYSDRIVIKTFDHYTKKWLDSLERVILLPLF